MSARPEATVGGLTVHAFDVPVDGPEGKEQDGTMTWSSTTMVLVEAQGGGETGLGYTYGEVSAAELVQSKLASVVTGTDAHCAPAVSAHAFCGVPRLRHMEYFHTHVRIEDLAFDGVLSPSGGSLAPDASRPGLGLAVKWADLEDYRVFGRRPS